MPIVGDITDEAHRADLATAAASLGGLDLARAQRRHARPEPAARRRPRCASSDLRDHPRDEPRGPGGRGPGAPPPPAARRHVVVVTSDAAVEAYEGWGAYGASKAGLEQLAAVLAAERPDLRVLRVDPGDMRTQMHQDAFPGEDISDRPPPEDSVPGLRRLIDERFPSRRYRVADVRTPLEVA